MIPIIIPEFFLVDLKQWREQEIQKKLFGVLEEQGWKTFASDQDVINGTLKGQIHTLMPRYNFFTNYRYFLTGSSHILERPTKP